MARDDALTGSEELLSLLNKVLEIETAFESLAEWEGYIKTKDTALADLVLRLYSDSNHHEAIVRSLFARMRGSGKATVPAPGPTVFSFEGATERQIAEGILRMETTARDTYGDILDLLDRIGPDALLKDGQSEEFMAEVKMLRTAEKTHVGLVGQFLDNL